ncbi:MAG: hypothetical protein PHG47_02005 [Sulfuricella sp.]|nr:hypothetical protein [Sulfuricella sp.]
MFSKLLAYHTGAHTEIYTWRDGTLSARHVFNADAEGFAGFAAYLKEHAGPSLYFLVDIVAEDFRLDTIPHLPGRSRAALIDRKLGQMFRNETHRHFALQGRMTEGRKDDRLLLSALTNSVMLTPWIDAALECKTPLAGIYSVPLLSQEIIPKLGLGETPHMLLLTRQNSAGLRQSYFQNGQLKFSRLVFTDSDGTDSPIQAINEECAKTRKYLNNQRLLPRDQPLEIHLLCRDDECGALVVDSANTPLHHQFVLHEMCSVAAALKLRYPPSSDVATLFLQFLARHDVKNHYARASETRYWRLNRVALAMKSSGIALVVLGALSAAYNITNGQGLALQADQTRLQAEHLEAQTQAIYGALPPLPAAPDILKGTVELAKHLTIHPRTPASLMAPVSRALEELPQIRLQQFKWAQTANPNLDINTRAASPIPTAEGPVPDTGSEIFEMALLEGEVSPFINYRDALAVVEQLISKLKNIPGLQVTPIVLPIETSPQSQLKGLLTEDAQPHAAHFSLKLIYRVAGS